MSLSSYEVIWKQVLDQVEQSNFFTEDTLRWIKNTTLFKIENSIDLYFLSFYGHKNNPE